MVFHEQPVFKNHKKNISVLLCLEIINKKIIKNHDSQTQSYITKLRQKRAVQFLVHVSLNSQPHDIEFNNYQNGIFCMFSQIRAILGFLNYFLTSLKKVHISFWNSNFSQHSVPLTEILKSSRNIKNLRQFLSQSHKFTTKFYLR